MTADEVMKALEKLGTESTRKTYLRHGCRAPLFGVKIGDMKVLMKKTGRDTRLAKELYKTGNYDAQYFAALIGNGAELTRAELQQWAKKACWTGVSEFSVPWMASEHPEAWDIGLGWIDSDQESIQSSGWSTLTGVVSTRPDEELDLDGVKKLLARVSDEIHEAPDRVKYTMNGFVIAVGASVKPLAKQAAATAKTIGTVRIDMGDTDCKVPLASEYIEKAIARSGPGHKRKTMKC